MELHFEWKGIERILEEVRTAKTAREDYNGETSKGLWLVGDQGVYLMANTSDGIHSSKRQKGEEHFVVYADQCNPDTMEFDDWWAYKRASFGGDDGVETIKLEEIDRLLAKKPSPTAKPKMLLIDISPTQFGLEIVWELHKSKKK